MRPRFVGAKASPLNFGIQRFSFGFRDFAKFSIQYSAAADVLLQRRGPHSAKSVNAHQATVDCLIQRIQLQTAAAVGQSLPVFSAKLMVLNQTRKHNCLFLPEVFGLKELPVLEGGAVSQVESGEELPPI